MNTPSTASNLKNDAIFAPKSCAATVIVRAPGTELVGLTASE